MPTPSSLQGQRYWLLIGNAPAGPFSADQLNFKLLAGEITWQALACPVGGTTWLPLAQLPGLGPTAVPVQAVQNVPPPPPAPVLATVVSTATATSAPPPTAAPVVAGNDTTQSPLPWSPAVIAWL
jgi:hypothetical protein